MTHNPYRIDGPAIVSFSGGRTSGYMLRQILDAHGGRLPDDVKVCFANTGKEHEATLWFVNQCAIRWGVAIAWLEWQAAAETKDRWRQVDFQTASRNGEPFEDLIKFRGYTPNVMARICTANLKVKTIEQYALSLGWTHWLNPLGLRFDEPRRVTRVLARQQDRWENCCPLWEAKVTKADIKTFWAGNDFDLPLPMGSDGSTPLGNCDLCFLKGPHKLRSIIKAEPWRADWWARMESESGKRFRNDRPDYHTLKQIADQPQFIGYDEMPDQIDCACTD